MKKPLAHSTNFVIFVVGKQDTDEKQTGKIKT